MSQSSKIKLPWSMRLMAWWEGYDAADLEAWLRQRPIGGASRLAGNQPEALEDIEKLSWTEIRIQLTNLVWGEGYCGPGGPKNVFEMARLLNLGPEKSVIVIGAGHGGPVRTLVKEYGVWVDGYESSPELARKGMEMSTSLGLAKKARITHKNLNTIFAFDRHYDCAFSKETIFTVENKLQLLSAIYHNLKPDGLFFFTDFILRDLDCFHELDVQKWIKQEPLDPFPVTAEKIAEMLGQVGFTIRSSANITENYLRLVAEAWRNAELLVRLLVERGEDAKESLETVANEAKFWERRKKIMLSGDLRVMRYLAHKKPEIK